MMKKRKTSIKTLAARLGVTLVLALLTTATAWAAVGDVVDSGTCGDNLTWTLAENDDDPNTVTWGNGTTGHTAYTLTITGSGAMADYTYSSMPWYDNQQSVTRLVLPDGLTHVGNYAFNTCNNVTSVTLPASVTSIGESAFTVVGVKASSCSFTAAEGSLLSSIGTDGFKGFGGDVDLRNCTSLTAIGEKVFENYKTNKVYLPVSMRTVAKDAFYSTSYSNNKPKVYVRCQNSVLAVNGKYKTSSTGTVSTAITTALDLKAKSSAAVSISQICFDDIALTWDSDGNFFAIADEQDLIDLAEYVRGGSDHGCEGVTVKMTADLDFTDMPDNYHDKNGRGSGNFLPIGLDNGTLFKGHFDGDGHSITGLRFDYPYTNVGLFRAIASAYAVVEGVTLVSPNFSAYSDVGGIAGGLQQGIVRNCAVVGGTLSVSNECVGGIVGYSNYYNSSSIKSISGCTVVGTTLSGPQYVGIIVGANSGTSDATAALTISGCTYHNPAGLDVCGYGDGDRYTDGGGNQRVYQARLSDGLTAATAAYSHGQDYYYTEGAAVTLGHGDRTGYDFGGYESSDVTISEGAFEMPASDVTVGATWTPSTNINLAANQAPDENYWTTFYCGDAGYTIDDGENACAYTAEYDGTNHQLTLHKLGKTIAKGEAVIIVADNNEVSMTKGEDGTCSDDNDLRGVDVDTPTADIQTTLGSGTFYVLGNKNSHFGFHKYTGATMAARKAFVLISGTGAALAPRLTMVFDDATGITTVHGSGFTVNGSDAWYSLDGRRLQGKPTKSGVYVNNGKKIVIK